VPQCPHHPAGYKQSGHEHGKAVKAVAELFASVVALSDAEDCRGKNRKQQSSVEVGESNYQNIFPVVSIS
jgi:hypothetical protein